MPLSAALARYAETQPDAPAVQIAGRTMSYGELYVRGLGLNQFLSALPRQQRAQTKVAEVPLIALHLGNAPVIPECLVAALSGEVCVMLLDPLLPQDRIDEILGLLPPDAVLTSQDAAAFPGVAPVFQLNCPSDLDALIAQAPDVETKPADPESPFMVAFTSGTTSRPKAFARDRAGWQRSLARGKVHFGTHPGLHTLSPGPLVHGLSLYAFAETLEAGACFHTMEKFNAAEAAKLIQSHDIPRLVCVPTMLEALERHGVELPQLSQITTAGAKLDDTLLAKAQQIAPNAQITEYYGASELGFVTTITHQQGSLARDQGVGQPFPGITLDIRNPDTDGNGEVWLQSDLKIQDYLWRDDALGFQKQGDWSSVGDIGRLDTHGDLHLISRAGGMVVSGGNNIYPDEVAAYLKSHPAIQNAVVLGHPDSYLGHRLVAILSFEDQPISAADLIAFCQQGLQKYKTPKAFLYVTDWPMTNSGKVSTGQLRDWIEEKDTRLASL